MDYQNLDIDLDLISKLDRNGPRYTSYPTADRFNEGFEPRKYATWAARRNRIGESRPLSLYVHLPFCRSLCYYCACNKIVTRDSNKAAKLPEVSRARDRPSGAALPRTTPSSNRCTGAEARRRSTECEELSALYATLKSKFEFAPDGEYSIEIDPRTAEPATHRSTRAALDSTGQASASRTSIRTLQRAVNRVQNEAQTAAVIEGGAAIGASIP